MAEMDRAKVSTVAEEELAPDFRTAKRTTQIARGVKYGLIKGTVDQVLEQIASPIAEKITPRLHDLHPGLQVADPAVQSLIEFAVLNALAEVLQFGGPALAKVPGLKMSPEVAVAKSQALAVWMRNYSGEKFGERIAETATALIPLVAGMLTEVNISELLQAVDDDEEEHVDTSIEVEEAQAIDMSTHFGGAVHPENLGGG
jgi:hypothetical protein